MNYQSQAGRPREQHPASAAMTPLLISKRRGGRQGSKPTRPKRTSPTEDDGEGRSDSESEPKSRRRKRPEPGALVFSYSEDDAATTAGCGRSTIRRAIDAGELVARKLYGRTLILDEDLRAWLRSLPIREPGRKVA